MKNKSIGSSENALSGQRVAQGLEDGSSRHYKTFDQGGHGLLVSLFAPWFVDS